MKLKALLLAAGLALFVNASYAQDISGDWQGTLSIGQQKRLSIVKIAKALDGWSGKLYNPDQGNDVGQSAPIDSITLQDRDVKLTVAAIQGRYEGKLSADGTSIEGNWTQGSQARPLVYPMVYQRATPETAWKDPSPHTSQFVTVDKDVQLEVLDWGGAGKPLVFLAGMGNSAHVFDKFAPKFTSTHHVYGISRRGFGASSVPATGYSADRLGDDVLAVLDFLKLVRPVLAGHSLGGEELSSIGSRFPDRVAGLIYLDAGYEYAFYDKARGAISIDLPELQRKLVQLKKQPALPLIKDLLETVLPAFERSLKQAQTDFEGMRPGEIAALAEDPSSPVEEAIEAGFQKYTVIPAPILAIFASPHKAPPVPPNAPPRIVERVAAMVAKEAAATETQVKAFENGLPSAKVIRLPGADHLIFISNETEVLREMNSFLASAAAQDSPLSPEETKIIEKAREVALEYTAKLPNFICTETVRRYQLPRRSQTWKLLDTLAVDVAFSDQGERYKLLTINGKPARKSFKEIGGVWSDAEFGSMLQWIFQPESQTKFQSERPTDLRGRPTLVFSYRIEQGHSKFEVNFGERFHMFAAFGGLVYVDRETSRVLKITAVSSGIPANWPATAFSQELDYGFAEISGQLFFLPLHAQANVTIQDGSQARNEIEFGNYRKFSSEATLQFEPQ